MTMRKLARVAVAIAVAGGGAVLLGERVPSDGAAPAPRLSMLPSESDAKTLLNSFDRHREWVHVPVGSSSVMAFVVYPIRADKAPVVMVQAKGQAATEWVRAVGDQVAAEGYIAVVTDAVPGASSTADAVRQYAVALPSANGTSASLMLDPGRRMLEVAVDARGAETTEMNLSDRAWPDAMAYLAKATGNTPPALAGHGPDEHAGHNMELMAAQQAAGQRGGAVAGNTIATKVPHLPAGLYTAESALANSPRLKEWVDIPVGDVNVRTFVVHPEGTAPAGVVIVMQHGVGLDIWMRAIADQIASEGFIAVAPDLWSGVSPTGGGWDSFRYPDEASRAAAGKIDAQETMRRYRAARDWALKLPRANGKTASLGFCGGGTSAFRFAGEVPELNGAVVFYGGPPDEATMAKINAPVLGLYGEIDARIVSTIPATEATMKKLGKTFEPHVYKGATHSFVLFQDIGTNPAALNDGWPRAMEFLKKNLM